MVWDTELKGCALRVSESGTKSYVLRYRPRGTGRAGPRRFMALGRHGVLTPDEARARISERYGVRGPFVLFVSSLWPYKNCDGLLRAFARADLSDHRLVVVGPGRDVEYVAGLRSLADQLGISISFHQSNMEGELVSLIQSARGKADAIIMNPAAYSFTSIALIDALKIFEGPIFEVHISNIHARDELHRHSKLSAAAKGVIAGLGRPQIRGSGSRSRWFRAPPAPLAPCARP